MTAPTIENGENLNDVRQKINAQLVVQASILSYIPASEHQSIKNGTSSYDIFSDLTGAIEDKPSTFPSAIYFPPGEYFCGSTIHLKKQVMLLGDSAGMDGSYFTTIRFAAGVAGVVVHTHNTNASGIELPTTGRGDGSIILGICLTGGLGAEAHGIQLRARAILSRAMVRNFSGDGVHVFATAGSGHPDTEGNANNFRIEGCSLLGNGGHGLFTKGADANAGVVISTDASANGGWGFYDSSFLGNTYVGLHTASNGLGSYKSDDPSGRNTFIGCYAETDQPPAEINPPAMFIGGAVEGLLDGGSTGGIMTAAYDGFRVNKLNVINDLRCYGNMGMASAVGDWRLHRDGETENLLFDFNYSAYQVVFDVSGTGTTFGLGGGRPNAVPFAFRPRNLFIGDEPRRVTNAAAVPTSGEWGRGDIIYNSAPSAAGFVGWVCVTGGTAGVDAVFKTFGSISA